MFSIFSVLFVSTARLQGRERITAIYFFVQIETGIPSDSCVTQPNLILSEILAFLNSSFGHNSYFRHHLFFFFFILLF